MLAPNIISILARISDSSTNLRVQLEHHLTQREPNVLFVHPQQAAEFADRTNALADQLQAAARSARAFADALKPR
jgi:hypothetical protein